MPQFDLRGIKAAKYVNTSGTITYTSKTKVGDAMTANLEPRFAEGRLYAESVLAEYIRAITGGTISLGVKYITDDAKTLLFGTSAKIRSVGTGSGATTVSSVVTTGKTQAQYVGVGFYAPDMVDGVEKYTAVFLAKALFGEPAMSLQTKGDNITFATPTTSGEFMAADNADQTILEVVTCDTAAQAIDWIDKCFGV